MRRRGFNFIQNEFLPWRGVKLSLCEESQEKYVMCCDHICRGMQLHYYKKSKNPLQL